MFNSNRNVTSGIQDKLGMELPILLWALIDKRKYSGVRVDYLQVFELSIVRENGLVIQKIIHTQEIPPVSTTYYFSLVVEEPIQGTVWVVDNEEYCTMLLPEEY